ncbi:MFS transporter [Phenylobacterium sp.]|uniref:MFS transporter n=1 Tax=Phenylobacterium sp. TaxID=1871053 RepID=UPI0028120B9B|nr:MFS transporter [Phenylobacterium sp.]
MKRFGFRWVVIGLIAVATVINYIDRNALAVMWPEISREIGASKEDYAGLVTVFMVFYALGQSVFGRVFDRLGTRIGFTISIVVWSAAIALHATARSVLAFGAFRALLGLSEAGAWPGAAKANAEWFPGRERAFAQGIFNSGASIGAIVSAPLIALMFVGFGWQATFLVVGGLGAVWLIPWLYLYRAGPAAHPWVSEAERAHILSGRDAAQVEADDGPPPRLGELLRRREAWGVILARFFLDPVWWLFVSWLPIYLAETFGFDIKQIGLFAWVPYVGAMIGSLFGGWLSGALIRRGWPVGRARKTAIAVGAAVMLPALLVTARAADPLLAVLVISVILFGFQTAIGNIQSLPADYFSGKSVGTLAGVSGTAAVAGVLLTTWLVPVMTKVSYAPIFVLAAAIVPLSLVSVLALGEARARPQAPPSQA